MDASSFRPSSSPPQHILLVHGNPDGLSARRQVLMESGYDVTTASNGEEALLRFLEHPIDLVVTSYKMSGLTGPELITMLRAQRADLPVILISGFADALGLTEASTGANVVIQKSATEVPFLLRSVKRLLQKKTPRKPPRQQPLKALVRRKSV